MATNIRDLLVKIPIDQQALRLDTAHKRISRLKELLTAVSLNRSHLKVDPHFEGVWERLLIEIDKELVK